MTAFRALLIIMILVVLSYTGIVVATHGFGFIPVFFGDIRAMGWSGQFNLDFTGLLVLSGLWLGWQVWSFAPWVLVKLALVSLLAAHYVWTGVLVLRARRGEFRDSDVHLRVFNEISVLVVIAVLWLVVMKPF